MKKITEYRFGTESILKSSRYRFGDLYGVSYLPEFKKDAYKETRNIFVDTCKGLRQINLYCICDSYLYSFINSPSIFCKVNNIRITRWGLDEPIEFEVDSNKINVLLIERVERCFLGIPLRDYLNSIKFPKKVAVYKREDIEIISQDASIFCIDQVKLTYFYNIIFNKNIEQNLDFNLFDYIIFTPLKELKALLNFKLFGRTSKEVTVIHDQPYLFLRETVDPESGQSAFRPIEDKQINSDVETLNSVYSYYRANGFDAVYYTIAPNPVSIICRGYKPYNDIIRRVQNHPGIIMPMINIFDRLDSSTCQVYYNADSHWNLNGFNIWLNEFNKYLRRVAKSKN